MAKSKRLKQLLSRIAFLEQNILPAEKLDGSYTKVERDLIKCYLLLAHAEIEAYFEDRAKEKVSSALTKWITNRQKSTCLKSVLAFSGNDINYDNTPKTDSKNIEFRMNKAVNHFLSLVGKNNGVKQSDILNLIIPIGIELSQLDNTWLNTMDSFGAARGNIAHNSIAVQRLLDRNTERDRINIQIIPEIERLDTLIQKLF
jgi:RiboL-PSP-HEPN